MSTPDPAHVIAIADEMAHVNVGSGHYSQSIGISAAMEAATELLDSTDPAVHAAMLDALTRHGVLTKGARSGLVWHVGSEVAP